MGISDGCSMRSRYTPYTHPSLYTTQCIYCIRGSTHGRGARTPISMTPLKIQGRVCACNCQGICVPVSYILWIPPPPCTDEARGWGDTGKGVTQSGSRRSAPGADHSERARDTVYGYVWRSPYAFTIYTLNSPLPVHHTVHAYIA